MYFNGRGLAELSRYILEVSGQKYEDLRWEESDWPLYKPNTPFGQAPVLLVTVSGKAHEIGQSKTIARFLAEKFKLRGKSELEKAKADMIVDQLGDLYSYYSFANYRQSNEDDKNKEIKKFTETKLHAYYSLLEGYLVKSKTEFFAGDTMTYADFDMALAVDRDLEQLGYDLDKYLLIKEIARKVNALPKIKEWKVKRPTTWF